MIKICLGISENISVKITAFYANFLRFQRQNYHQISMTLLSQEIEETNIRSGTFFGVQFFLRGGHFSIQFGTVSIQVSVTSLVITITQFILFLIGCPAILFYILGPDSRSLEGLLEIQTFFPPERNFVKSQKLGVLFR